MLQTERQGHLRICDLYGGLKYTYTYPIDSAETHQQHGNNYNDRDSADEGIAGAQGQAGEFRSVCCTSTLETAEEFPSSHFAPAHPFFLKPFLWQLTSLPRTAVHLPDQVPPGPRPTLLTRHPARLRPRPALHARLHGHRLQDGAL